MKNKDIFFYLFNKSQQIKTRITIQFSCNSKQFLVFTSVSTKPIFLKNKNKRRIVKNVDKRGRRSTRFVRLINLCPRFSVARGYRRCCLSFLVTVCWRTDIFAPTDIRCNGPGTQGRRLSRFRRESTARRIISVLRCGFNLEIFDDTSCI